LPDEDILYVPGCWAQRPVDKDHVCWRFCGSFFWGTAKGVKRLKTLYDEHWLEYRGEQLTWEVNFWAWLEMHKGWRPRWYQADHNDSLVQIPTCLHDIKTVTYDYPNLLPYRPMSAAFVEFKGEQILNTRYVNYWIQENGGYWFPENERVIRTKNVMSRLKDYTPIDYQEVPELPSEKEAFSEGVEDIRLYATDRIRFIGSTLQHSYCDKMRMVVGDYDGTLRNVRCIRPPEETWCEKNWAPVPLPSCEGFVYKWHPLEIGKIVDDKLEIVIRHATPECFAQLKGSTPFVPYETQTCETSETCETGQTSETGKWVAIAHFSEETSPRRYFHRVIVLDRELKVYKYSGAFCFLKEGVEFCVGMAWNNGTIRAWISQMDRDPVMVEFQNNVIGYIKL